MKTFTKNNHIRVQVFLFMALGIILMSCTPTGDIIKIPNEPITIGGLFALSGDGASWGSEEMNGALLAIEEVNAIGGINQHVIQMITEDSKTNPRDTTTAVKKLIESSNLSVIIGPTWDESAIATIALAEPANVVVISPSISGAIEETIDHPFLFSPWFSDAAAMQALLQDMKQRGFTNVAVVYNQNAWSSYVTRVFVENAPLYGITVSKTYSHQDAETDFRTTILKILKINNADHLVDAILFAFTADETMQPFLQQARELGLTIPLYTPNGSETDQLAIWQEAYGIVYHMYPRSNERLELFKKKYKTKYGMEPTAPSAPVAYDAAKLIIEAMKDGARTGEEIQSWLSKINNFPSVSVGNLTFDKKGYVDAGRDAYVIKTIKDRKWVIAG